MIAASIWAKLNRQFSSSSTTRLMNLYDRLNLRKLYNQFMREYLTDIQLVYDSLAGCGHPIEEMQHISIILNGVKGQFDNVVFVIHFSRNPYDLASINSVLLDVEARQKEIIFDNISAANVVVKSSFRKCISKHD